MLRSTARRAAIVHAADFEGLIGQRVVYDSDLDADRFDSITLAIRSTSLRAAMRRFSRSDFARSYVPMKPGPQQPADLSCADDAGEAGTSKGCGRSKRPPSGSSSTTSRS